MTKKMTITIRKAKQEDLETVHDLVRGLAIYEKAEASFTASLKEYQEDFEAGWFECQVAENEGVIVGMVIYYETFSTWKGRMLYLEDFYVKEAVRRFGVGQKLFDAFHQTAREKGCKMTKWQVIDWNTPAVKFYEKNNAIIEKEWWNVKIFLE